MSGSTGDRWERAVAARELPRNVSDMRPATCAWARNQLRGSMLPAWSEAYPLPVGQSAFVDGMQRLLAWEPLILHAAGLPFDGNEAALFVYEEQLEDGGRMTFFGLCEPAEDEDGALNPFAPAGLGGDVRKIMGVRCVYVGPNPGSPAVSAFWRDMRAWWAEFEGKTCALGRPPGGGVTEQDIVAAYHNCLAAGETPTQENVAKWVPVSARYFKALLAQFKAAGTLRWPPTDST